MLRKRIIPKLLLHNGRAVKGVQFEELRDTGSPITKARIYDAQGADELLLLDIDAYRSDRAILTDIVSRAAKELFLPLCVGGGVRSIDTIRTLLLAGADKVAINTAAADSPSLVERAARTFGSQCIVISVDFRALDGQNRVFVEGGTKPTNLNPVSQCVRMANAGAGEILLTSIDRDGTMQGYDLEVLEEVACAAKIPIIASGGAGTLEHMASAIHKGAHAVAVGSLFDFTDQSPIKARSYFANEGIPVRTDG